MASRRSRKKGALDTVIAPLVGAVVLVVAAVQSLRQPRGGEQGDLDAADSGAGDEATGIRAKLERAGDRFPPLGYALAVQKRYGELHGNNLAAAITFQAFLSLLPLLLVAVAVVGFFSANSDDLAADVVSELGLTGSAADLLNDAITSAERTRIAASVVGLAGLLWAGLGLIDALQHGFDRVWQVERRGFKDKLYGLMWLVGATVLLAGAAAVTTVLRLFPAWVAPVGVVVALGANFLLFVWSAKVLPNRKISWRSLVPGAVFGAIGLEVLKLLGAYWVPRTVANSSELYGSLGVVFAVLAWLLLFARLVLYSAVINVVAAERRAGTVTAEVAVPRASAGARDQANRSGQARAGAQRAA